MATRLTRSATATGCWFGRRPKAGPPGPGTGWYDDHVVRTDDGWRIKKRVCRLQGWTGNPLVPEPHNEHNPDMNVKVLHTFAEAGEIGFLNAVMGQ